MDAILFSLLGVLCMCGALWARGRYASFLSQRPEDYASAASGRFDIRTHFNGPVRCEGAIFGPLGRVSSRFEADFECRWEGNRCIMEEVFRYDDGTVQERAWTLQLGNDGRIKATAADVVGDGTGVQLGDAVQLQYKLRLPEASGGHILSVVDWMYLAPGGVIINRSQFRKFGFKVAELVATMRPVEQQMKEAA